LYPISAPRLELDVQRHAALLEMADVLSRHHEPSDLFRALAPSLSAVVPFDFLDFALHESSGQLVKFHVWDGETWPAVPLEIAVNDAAVDWVWERQQPLAIDDLERETRFKRGLEWLRSYHLRSYCLVPLTSPQTKLGALGVGSRRPHAFSSHQIRYLQRLADIVAHCVDKTLVLSTLAEERKRIELLLGQAGTLTTASTLNPQFTQLENPLEEPPTIATVSANSVSMAVPENLYNSDQLLTAYFGSSTVGLAVVDRHLRFLAINKALADMNGMPAAEHLGKTVQDVLGAAAHAVEPAFRRVLASGQPVLDFEVSVLLPGRTEFGYWVEHFFPIKSADGGVDRVGAVVVEISKQKKLEESFRTLTGTLKKEKERLQVLLEISRVLAVNWDVEKVFPKISAVLRRVLRHEGASFGLYDEERSVFVRQAVDFPLSKGLFSAAPSTTTGGPQGQAVAERHAITFSKEEIAAFQSEPSVAGVAQSLLDEGIKSLCCVPLVRPGGPVGALSLASTRADAFHPEDLSLLNQVGAQLAIALENARVSTQIRELKDRLVEEKRYLEAEIHTEHNFEEIIGNSPALRKVLEQVATVATSNATVLILGETGTGKELVARAIHRISRRKDKNFIKVNCAAIPTGLLESELFGHEKGAFTGAVSQKIGRMELADMGTLFLDEVGDIPLELQPKLLRVLQDQEFERLGSTRTIKVNVRLIAATNRDLGVSVAAHEFRSDLFYRLNVFPVRVPPLRDRRTDIPMLVRYFIEKFSRRMERHIETIPSETMTELMNWHWPGNVRELENFIERSVILSDGTALRAPLAELAETGRGSSSDYTLENAEREHIIRVLRETGGVIAGQGGAAHRLGLKRTTLQSKMRKLRIRREDYITAKKASPPTK
jgi:formate hydrogenlyase transcriptional activator